MLHLFQVSCFPTLVHKMPSCRYCRIQKHAQHFCFKRLARFRNSRGHRGIAFDQVLAVPGPTVLHSEPRPKCLAPSTGGIQHRFLLVLAVPKHSHNHAHNAFPQLLTGVRNSPGHGGIAFTSYKHGHLQIPPYCIQNHAENALPQVLTGFRINQSAARGNRFPQTTPTIMLGPKYWRDSESINGMGVSLSPKYWRFLDS